MSLPNNLGRLSAGLTADASLNIGVGVTPSGTYKFEVGTTSKFTGVATFGSTLSNGTYTYTLPSATGTLALTSDLSGYLPLTGGTLTGALGGTSATFNSSIQTGGDISLMNSSGDISLKMKDNLGNADRVLTRQGSTNNVYIGDIDANGGQAIIRANGNDAITVTSGGNVGIGTTSPNGLGNGGTNTTLEVFKTGGTGYLSLTSDLTASGSLLGVLNFGSTGSTSGPSGASIQAVLNGSGTSYANTDLIFYTRSTTTFGERMRITSSGDIQINGSTSNTGIILRNNTTADRYFIFVGGGGSYIADDCYVLANNTDYHIKNNGGGVKLSNGATSWVADSDIRLKDKVSDIDNAIGIISQLETLKFTWKRDSQLENKPVYFGLVAQNAKEIMPEVVDTGRDEMQTLGIRYTEVIPILVKAIQEQQQQIKELQSQINK